MLQLVNYCTNNDDNDDDDDDDDDDTKKEKRNIFEGFRCDHCSIFCKLEGTSSPLIHTAC